MIYLAITLTQIPLYERNEQCQIKSKKIAILAWNLPFEICAKLIDYIKEILFSPDFVNRHKNSQKDFSRDRKLTFQTIFLFLINFIKGSYKDELDHYFKALFRLDVAISFVTKMAFSLARKKINYTAFIEMNRHLVEFFETHFQNRKRWCGFNLLAVDGSGQKLFKYNDVIKHFGTMKPKKGPERPMARISQLYDVLNKVTVDAIICPYKIGERELLRRHAINLLPDDLLLLDRGYPAYWVFNLILSQGANFCARINKQWKVVQEFVDSGLKDELIDLIPSYESKNECLEMGLDTNPLKLRLIRIELDTGEIEVLITSLLDGQQYPHKIFKDLYHKRWPVETDYLFIKKRIELGNFSGKTALSVYQDFHAKIFAKNLSFILASPVNDAVASQSEDKKYEYQINQTEAISKSKDTLILLFQRPKEIVLLLIQQIQALFISSTEPIRPGRKFKRNHKMNKREFYMNYKPCR